MANEPSKTPTTAKPQSIPLSKIHDLPGIYTPKPQDKSLGSMVLSIETSGVKEPVILRQRDDGEYQLLSGYRRRRACELAKKPDIPAHVYEMTITLTTKEGTRTYSVTSVMKVDETDNTMLEATSDNCITLFTCVRDEREYRWCVRAVEV